MQMKKSYIALSFLVWALASNASPIPKNEKRASVINDSKIEVPEEGIAIYDIFQKIEEDLDNSVFTLSSDSEDQEDSDVPY